MLSSFVLNSAQGQMSGSIEPFIFFLFQVAFTKTFGVKAMAKDYFLQWNIYDNNCGIFFGDIAAPRVTFLKL
jgi:hypothetical protein